MNFIKLLDRSLPPDRGRVPFLPALILWVAIFAAFGGVPAAKAQIVEMPNQEMYIDSLKKEFDYGPFFGLYKDNYFLVGTDPFHKPSSTNSDVKFQISLRIRLTNAVLPWHTYLFLTYTQRNFWNVFEESLPMHDMNYNPAIGWSKPFFSKDRYVGTMTLLIEHESNGRDGPESRSWNRVSLCGSAVVNEWLMVHSKIWIPIIDSGNNADILDYNGIWESGFVVTTRNKKFQVGFTAVKRRGWNLNFNTITDFTWLISPKTNLNLFAQYYNGYGENLLDYNKFHSRLRVGIVFKPKFFSEF